MKRKKQDIMFSILIQGWIKYPHSYSIVNIYQIIALSRLGGVKIYLKEELPYKESWVEFTNLTDIIITREEQEILDNVERWDGKKEVDMIYRITYPFDISNKVSNIPMKCPIVLFYTSEFQIFRQGNFSSGTRKTFFELCNSQQILPVTPSNWSAMSMIRENFKPLVIPHGVDTSKYFPISNEERFNFRNDCDIPQNAFVFLNVGAMTSNKNIKGIIKAFYRVSHTNDDIYLVLKGLGNLYDCQTNINNAVKELKKEKIIQKDYWKQIKSKIVYLDDLFGYKDMCKLYNMADCYVSPYMGEGFNLPVLEAVACGIPVIIPEGGATDDFTTKEFALYPFTTSYKLNTGEYILVVNDLSLQEMMVQVIRNENFRIDARIQGPKYVNSKFTWNHVAETIYNFLNMMMPIPTTNMRHSHLSLKCKP